MFAVLAYEYLLLLPDEVRSVSPIQIPATGVDGDVVRLGRVCLAVKQGLEYAKITYDYSMHTDRRIAFYLFMLV